jgi:hypothetical protein
LLEAAVDWPTDLAPRGGLPLDLEAAATPADFDSDDEGPRPSVATLHTKLWQIIEQAAFCARR